MITLRRLYTAKMGMKRCRQACASNGRRHRAPQAARLTSRDLRWPTRLRLPAGPKFKRRQTLPALPTARYASLVLIAARGRLAQVSLQVKAGPFPLTAALLCSNGFSRNHHTELSVHMAMAHPSSSSGSVQATTRLKRTAARRSAHSPPPSTTGY